MPASPSASLWRPEDARSQMPDVTKEPVENEPVESRLIKEEPEPENVPTLFSNKNGAEKHALPKLTGGLNALLASVKQESNENAVAAAAFNLENLQNAWQQYVDAAAMVPNVKLLFQNVEFVLSDFHITAVVAGALAENAIREEGNIITHLRHHFNLPQLTFSIKRSEKKADVNIPKPQKPLSAKEKYLKMRELNPALQELQKRFDLRPDEEM